MSQVESPAKTHYTETMSTLEILTEEIRRQPEEVRREVLNYLRYVARQHEEAKWADVLPGRELEQEVLDILDAHDSAAG